VAAAPAPRFTCPEKLPDDAARMKAVRDHVVRYRVGHPGASIAESLAVRDRLLAQHRCKAEVIQHSFPER
jgi:hypothetical protein